MATGQPRWFWLVAVACGLLIAVLFALQDVQRAREPRIAQTSDGERANEAGKAILVSPTPFTDEPISVAEGSREPVDGGAARPRASEATVRWLHSLLPDRFGALTLDEAQALQELDLSGAAITDADLALLAGLPELRSLRLRDTAISDRGLAALRALPLEFLDLRDTHVSGACFSSLPTATLHALHLTDTQVAGADLAQLPAMPALEVLKLNGLTVSDADLEALAIYPHLKHVELDSTGITDAGLRRLLELEPQITRVEARGTRIRSETVRELRAAHPELEVVLENR